MAKAATQSQFEQVSALYEERQRFEAWLAALEAKRATTPVHIYTRVHADYGARLQRVVEELRTHRTALQELESTLIDRLTALDSDEAKQRDEAAEAELRATVGELASDHFNEVTQRTSAAIAGLSEERSSVQTELSQLRHLLDVGTAPLPVAAVTTDQQRADDSRIRMVDSGSPVPPPSPPDFPAPPPADWELAFEKAVTGSNAPPRTSGQRPAEKAVQTNPFDDLEFLKTMVDRNSGEQGIVKPAKEHAPEPAAAAPNPITTVPTSPPVRQRPSQPAPVPASGLPLIMPDAPAPPRVEPRFPHAGGRESVPSYLKESPPEQVKTLKCQECGTLNYPTEWYCERCGAELAAL
jgi:Skp family chaperone for outer membrane proteins